MNKYLFITLICCFTKICSAQTSKFGFIGGFNESTFRESFTGIATSSNETISSASIAGFNAGVFSQLKFNKVSIFTELLYTVKGGNITEFVPPDGGFTFHETAKLTLRYIELPINLVYNIPVATNTIFVGGGPYIGYGINGTTNTFNILTTNGVTTTNNGQGNVTFGNSSTDYKSLDFGLDGTAGYEFKNHLIFIVKYAYGLQNNTRSPYNKSYNNSLSLSAGFSFL